MGTLVEGRWVDEDTLSALQNKEGAYVRADSTFRDWVTADGSSGHPVEPGRYHLFLAHSCPWAHRTHICVNFLGLERVIGTSFAVIPRGPEGWAYAEGLDEFQPRNGTFPLHRVYTATDPAYSGRVTTPALWDRVAKKVVNNESADILRMLGGAFTPLAEHPHELYPQAPRDEIDRINARVYASFNNGVYRCGFASSQEAYEEAYGEIFETLDEMEQRLNRHRYLVGDQPTEADLRIFPTLVRFDPVYYSHFKCNRRRIADYPNLSNYLRDLYQLRGFGETVNVDLYKRGYYGNSPGLNPTGIVPLGPELNYDAPHDRATRQYSG